MAAIGQPATSPPTIMKAETSFVKPEFATIKSEPVAALPQIKQEVPQIKQEVPVAAPAAVPAAVGGDAKYKSSCTFQEKYQNLCKNKFALQVCFIF